MHAHATYQVLSQSAMGELTVLFTEGGQLLGQIPCSFASLTICVVFGDL